MYQLLTGPLLWFAFVIFFAGIIFKAIWYVRGLNWQLDRVAYSAWPQYGFKGAVRSIFFWLVPFGTHSWRQKPGMTTLFFGFHIGLVITPLFLSSHLMILNERWGFSWAALPGCVADILTIILFITGLFLILRRIAYPEVRILTTSYDYLILAISIAPFLTGFLARHQVGNYDFWLILHIITGEIMLVAIPFTKLSHVILFFMSRAQLGMDYGIKRGGMKRNLNW